MLKIIYGNYDKAIYNTAVYFKNTFEDEWITDLTSVEMIFDIDTTLVDMIREFDENGGDSYMPKREAAGRPMLVND